MVSIPAIDEIHTIFALFFVKSLKKVSIAFKAVKKLISSQHFYGRGVGHRRALGLSQRENVRRSMA
jgi:hypothetical protein